MKKRLGSILLVLAMALTLLPWSAFPARAESERAALMLGASGLIKGDTVYFGQNGDVDFRKWHVVASAADTSQPVSGEDRVLLLSLWARNVVSFGTSNTWAGSAAQTWCTGFYNNVSQFNALDRAAIAATTVTETNDVKNDVRFHDTPCILFYNNIWYGAASLNGDYFFFLSAAEAKDLDKSIRRTDRKPADNQTANADWWLRSPNVRDANYIGTVDDTGSLSHAAVNKDGIAARPACNLDASSVLFIQAPSEHIPTAGTLEKIKTGNFSEWKLTLLDSDRSEFSAHITASNVNVNGGTVEIAYSGAKTGANEYVSVLLCGEDGTALCYGVSEPLTDTSQSDGKVTFTLPRLGQAGRYTLKVCNEQRNDVIRDGYLPQYYNNYASALQEIELPVIGFGVVLTNGNDVNYEVAGMPENTLLIAARYDGGRMTDVQTVDFEDAARKSGTLTMQGSGTTFKAMLVDGTTFAPLCPAWDSTLDYS